MIVPRRILHVEDDPAITSLIAVHLKAHGYETTPFHDPRQFIRQLPTFQERVVLLDIDMPGINGLEVLKKIKEFDGGVQVVMLTGLVTMTTALQSLRLGAEACFFKPIHDIQPLVDGLETCFQKIQQWWNTLDDLSHRRKAESDLSLATAESLLNQAMA